MSQINRPERPDFSRCREHIELMDCHNSLAEVVHSLLHRIEELEERVSKLEGSVVYERKAGPWVEELLEGLDAEARD